MMKESIYIIIPVHNRKRVTLNCLENLDKCGDRKEYNVVVVDDGSTDGTAEAIRSQYPEVTILNGDGNLWWTGAIRKGMEYAYDQGAEYFIWLNDDTLVINDVISKLIEFCKSNPFTIVSSQCYENEQMSEFSYGGQLIKFLQIKPIYANKNEKIECDALDGNLVCLPRSIVDDLGYPKNHETPHYAGDTIYTLWAKKIGYKLYVDGTTPIVCSSFKPKYRWITAEQPILKIWQNLLSSPRELFYVPSYFYLCLNCWGILGILVFVKPYLKLLVITLIRLIIPARLLSVIYFSK